MNENKALKILEQLRLKPPGDFKILELAGTGKSAAVFQAESPGLGKVAIKIFDPELESRYGIQVQEERIRRQLELTGHSCQTLVEILSSGQIEIAGEATHFIAMRYLDGENLRKKIAREGKLSDATIRRIFKDVYLAADFLFRRGLCHRDIKPENVQIKPNGESVLLDLGVMRPITTSSNITEVADGRSFVGTLRYSSPEMLHGQEKQDPDGWTAVTIYQLGTLLYEMIMGEELFAPFKEPFPTVVHAVDNIEPIIYRTDVGQDLVSAAQKCLYKTPLERLKLINWNKLSELFLAPIPPPSIGFGKGVSLGERLRQAKQTYHDEVVLPAEKMRKEQERIMRYVKDARDCAQDAVILPIEGFPRPKIDSKEIKHPVSTFSLVMGHFAANIEHNFPQPVTIVLRIPYKQDPIGKVQISGLAVRGYGVAADIQFVSKLILNLGQNAPFEILKEDLFNPQVFRQVIQDWVVRIIEKFMDDTKDLLQKEIDCQKVVMARGSISRQIPMTMYVFNSKVSLPMTTRGCSR